MGKSFVENELKLMGKYFVIFQVNQILMGTKLHTKQRAKSFGIFQINQITTPQDLMGTKPHTNE